MFSLLLQIITVTQHVDLRILLTEMKQDSMQQMRYLSLAENR